MSQVALRSVVRRKFTVHILLGISALLVPATASGHGVSLGLADKEVIPGSECQLELVGDLDHAIRGYQVGIEFPQYALSFIGASFVDTDLPSSRPAFTQVASAPGQAVLTVIADNQPPFENPIPAGDRVLLGRLRFKVVQGLSPGSEYTVSLRSNLGLPPAPALIYAGTGTEPAAALGAGKVRVVDRNVLSIRDLQQVAPNTVQVLELAAFNISPLQGFSIGVRYDPAIVRFLEVDLTDTITEAVGAEYVAPIIDPIRGHFVLGVLLDSVPPFANQVIPASGLDLTIAKVKIQVLQPPAGAEFVDLELVDGLGTPPIRNLFVIDNQSVAPDKQNGRLLLSIHGPFIRGDVNGDGRVDISDPIATADWLFRAARDLECHKAADADDDGNTNLADIVYSLFFLFDRGGPIPPPYPTAGLDPTPDDLRCPL